MAKSPAAVVLRHSSMLLCGGNDKSVGAVYKGLSNDVAHDETRARVFNVESESARVGLGRVSGKAGA